jgi:hypothetical protein
MKGRQDYLAPFFIRRRCVLVAAVIGPQADGVRGVFINVDAACIAKALRPDAFA